MSHSCPYCAGNDLDLVARREEIPYGISDVISVIMPIRVCNDCGQKWTDQYGEVIRDFAVKEFLKEKK